MVVAYRADDLAALAVAGVDDPAQFFSPRQERVRFVDKQRRPMSLDDAKNGRRRHVGARQRSPRQKGNDVKQSCLATPMKRRSNG